MDTSYRLDARRCSDFDAGRKLEWLVANGRGGYASTTVSQALTRRYHGLLVAAVKPPVQRFVLLAKLEATVMLDGLTYELASNDFPEVVAPTGYKLLDSFSLRPFPTWRWRVGDSFIEQTLCMVESEDTTFIQFRLIQGDRPVSLTVRPLCASRHFHHLVRAADSGDSPLVNADIDQIHLQWPGDRPAMYLSHNGEFRNRPNWYYNFELSIERERGYDALQDLYMPGTITATLRRGDQTGLVIAASTQRRPWRGFEPAFSAAAEKSEDSLGTVRSKDPLADSLLRAAGDFIVERDGLNSVIAGYPWFEDWGRDTFISLPGLCLVPGRFDQARNIIRAFAGHVDQGLIPNRFPPYGEPPVYNTVDGTLWYINALDRYLAYTGDWAFVEKEMYPVITQIIEAHERGTRHNIRQDEDGLLFAGEDGYALTWMDARFANQSVTPRIGKAVEICALWYNALCIAASFAERMNDRDRAKRWRSSADVTHASFNKRFWRKDICCLYDVIDADGQPDAVDRSVRPNQLFAVSLTHPVLDESRRRSVVAICERDLFTPNGLRTLSPADSRYRPRYEGGVEARDGAYHQGTVWPWLLGPFVTAYVRAYEGMNAARQKSRSFLDGLEFHLDQAGIGSVSEVADGDPPHTPGGCPWQAWSVAEPLRALCEDVLCTHPSATVGRPRETARPAGVGARG